VKPPTLLAAVGVGLLTAMFVAERQQDEAPVSVAPIVNFVASAERDASRAPMAMTRMTDMDEIRIGEAMAARARGDGSSPASLYLNRVGSVLASRAHRRLPYKFYYLPQASFVNAYALPGGHIFVGEGLLRLMQTEDELAAVIGHEIEHVDHYHCAERVQTQAALRGLPLAGLVALPLEIFEAGYGKDQELEADREGIRLSASAGYAPDAVIRLFEAMEEARGAKPGATRLPGRGTPADELGRLAADAIEGYFRSHPPTPERVAQVRQVIAEDRLEAGRPTRPLGLPVPAEKSRYFLTGGG